MCFGIAIIPDLFTVPPGAMARDGGEIMVQGTSTHGGFGRLLALAATGGLALAVAGCSQMEGKGGADRNGDGKISLQEFGAELKEMKHPKPGKWKIAAEGKAGGDDSFIRFTGEVALCNESFWKGFDQGLGELAKSENEKQFNEALAKFAKENNGKFDLERFDVDGDKIDFKSSGSGKGNEGKQAIDGSGSVALKGTVSETLVDLEGKFAYQFTMNGEFDGSKMTLEANMTTITKLKGERIGDCPAAPPRPEGQSFELAPEAPAPVAPPAM
jgi:hypothetical protein